MTNINAIFSFFTGTYIRKEKNSGATIFIELIKGNKIKIKGSAYWGKNENTGPNIGEIDFISEANNENLIFRDEFEGQKIEIYFTLLNDNLKVEEIYFPHQFSYFGLNVSFAGEYKKLE